LKACQIFLAAFHWIWAEDRAGVAPVAILGASMSIHPVALRYFRGKRVRIFPHYDVERLNGFDAARRWEVQLRGAGATVDCFDRSGLARSDGRPVSDLNDLCSNGYEQWQEELRGLILHERANQKRGTTAPPSRTIRDPQRRSGYVAVAAEASARQERRPRRNVEGSETRTAGKTGEL
jgi:hypothetical protein